MYFFPNILNITERFCLILTNSRKAYHPSCTSCEKKFSYLWAAQRRALALPLLSIDGTARQVSLEKVLLLTVALGTLRALRAFGDLHKGV